MDRHVAHTSVHAGSEPPVEVVESVGVIGGGDSDEIKALLEGPLFQLACESGHLGEYGMRLAAGTADDRMPLGEPASLRALLW